MPLHCNYTRSYLDYAVIQKCARVSQCVASTFTHAARTEALQRAEVRNDDNVRMGEVRKIEDSILYENKRKMN